MICMLCDTDKDLVRLSCGGGTHYICVDCNNNWFNTPQKHHISGQDLPGTNRDTCPMCRAPNTIIPVNRTMVPIVVSNQLKQRVGVNVNRFVPAVPPPVFVGLYDGLPPPKNS